jgi:aldehyde dehydrogenase (NAD+)
MGDPINASTYLGPLADTKQLDRVMAYLKQGKQDAKLVTGGVRKGDTGNFIEPTIFLDPPTESTIYKEEIFGPVLVVKTFETEEEGVELANDTSYGLAGKSSRVIFPFRIMLQARHPRLAVTLKVTPNRPLKTA